MNDAQRPIASEETDPRIEFREVMGLFTTGVCIVSVPAGEQGVTAMTVNSLVSVSLEPRLLCWSLQNDASQFDLYVQAERFAVSILAENQAELALRYAARGDVLLRASDFAQSEGGLPVIPDALGHIECARWSDFVAGDHTMIFGEVTDLAPHCPINSTRAPLGFFGGKFCSIDS